MRISLENILRSVVKDVVLDLFSMRWGHRILSRIVWEKRFFKRRRNGRLGSNMRQYRNFIMARRAQIATPILWIKLKHLLKLSHQPTQFLFKINILTFIFEGITDASRKRYCNNVNVECTNVLKFGFILYYIIYSFKV